MYADVRTCFNNYMNSVLDVFSILSAVKRGDNVATTELMRSCPELALDKANLLLQATPSFRTSLLSAKLPLFSKQFMQASLMGFIPFAAISEDNIEQEYAYFGCDLFKLFKTTILRNIEVLRKYLLQHVSSEVASIISVQETGYESCEMRGMYEEYYSASKGSLGKFLEGRYSCYFIDYVLYLEALAYYKGIPMKEARMFKFLNLVSPVKLNRGDEK